MYDVSEAYLNKLTDISRKRRRIRGTIDGISFTENDILKASFVYTDICVKSADIKLGGVFVGTLKLTFLSAFISRITRGTWRGRVLNINVSLFVGYDQNDNEVWEAVPLKPFVIDTADHSALGVDIVAYDYMTKFDATIQMSTTEGNLYGMLSLACSACGVTLGMSAAQVAALPNGDQVLGLYPENDIETWRDLVSWCAATAGGFATINRSGELEIRTWHTTPDIEIGVNDRFKGGSWSDFVTDYTAVKLQNVKDKTEDYYAISEDTGLTLDLGANPLLQYGVASIHEQQVRAILTAVQSLKYTPFKSTSLIDPALDLGDVISYADGIANDALCCVMRIDFSFQKGATVQGYGKDPSLSGARSAQDKAIAQAARNNREQGIIHCPFINTSPVTLTTEAKRLYRISFEAAEETTVDIWHEVKWDITTDDEPVTITYEYYLDGVKFDYEPVDTYGVDGYHSTPHPYWLLDVSGGIIHQWEVKAKLNSGSAVAEIGDIHALLKGQKLVGSVRFDGNIECSDEMTPIVLHRAIATFLENVSVATQRPIRTAISESVPVMKLRRRIVSLTDEATLTGRLVEYTRTTEDGGTRYTEDNSKRITE